MHIVTLAYAILYSVHSIFVGTVVDGVSTHLYGACICICIILLKRDHHIIVL